MDSALKRIILGTGRLGQRSAASLPKQMKGINNQPALAYIFSTRRTLAQTDLNYSPASDLFFAHYECKFGVEPSAQSNTNTRQIIEWAFGKRMTPAERLRKHQRALEKTQRELDRERVKLENQEKKLVADIKKSAKNGQVGACKIQAKDLVRTRRYITKFYQMRTQLQAISLRIQTVRSNEQMMQSMKGATSLLGSMNRQMNLPALQRIAMEFERENDIMDQRQEMMDDAIDESTGMEDEEEGEEVVNQVLDEIGVDLNQQLGETPTGLQKNTVAEGRVAEAIGGGGGGGGGAGGADDDLQARLDSLRK